MGQSSLFYGGEGAGFSGKLVQQRHRVQITSVRQPKIISPNATGTYTDGDDNPQYIAVFWLKLHMICRADKPIAVNICILNIPLSQTPTESFIYTSVFSLRNSSQLSKPYIHNTYINQL